jgi:hypothetical protein
MLQQVVRIVGWFHVVAAAGGTIGMLFLAVMLLWRVRRKR